MGPTQLHWRICPPLDGKSIPRCHPPPPPISCCEFSNWSAKNKMKQGVFHMSKDYLQALPAHWKETGKIPGWQCSSAPQYWSHSPALRLFGKDGALGSDAEPQSSLRKHSEDSSPFLYLSGDDKFRIEKCLGQRFTSLMGSINISLISNPTENGPFSSSLPCPILSFYSIYASTLLTSSSLKWHFN